MVQDAETSQAMMEDFVIEELETRLEMAWCCVWCDCAQRNWKGDCTGWICKYCHTC